MAHHRFLESDTHLELSAGMLTAGKLLTHLDDSGAAWLVRWPEIWSAIVKVLGSGSGSGLDENSRPMIYEWKAIGGTSDLSEPTMYLFGRKGERMNVSIRSPQTLDQ